MNFKQIMSVAYFLSNPNSTTFSGCSTPGQCENVGLNEGQAVLMVPQKGLRF